jgi:hypothetical protein
MNAERITDRNKLIPGILYCLVRREFDYERDYEAFGALVYWDGYDFIYEDGDRCNDAWDSVVTQSETPDSRYISEPQYTFDDDGKEIDLNVWRERGLAKWRAECAARGVVV